MTEHDAPETGKEHATHYTVNGEDQQTTEKTLKVEQILENAGFSPATDYELEDDANAKTYTDLAQEIHVHEKQSFTATFTGTTPTS